MSDHVHFTRLWVSSLQIFSVLSVQGIVLCAHLVCMVWPLFSKYGHETKALDELILKIQISRIHSIYSESDSRDESLESLLFLNITGDYWDTRLWQRNYWYLDKHFLSLVFHHKIPDLCPFVANLLIKSLIKWTWIIIWLIVLTTVFYICVQICIYCVYTVPWSWAQMTRPWQTDLINFLQSFWTLPQLYKHRFRKQEWTPVSYTKIMCGVSLLRNCGSSWHLN